MFVSVEISAASSPPNPNSRVLFLNVNTCICIALVHLTVMIANLKCLEINQESVLHVFAQLSCCSLFISRDGMIVFFASLVRRHMIALTAGREWLSLCYIYIVFIIVFCLTFVLRRTLRLDVWHPETKVL